MANEEIRAWVATLKNGDLVAVDLGRGVSEWYLYSVNQPESSLEGGAKPPHRCAKVFVNGRWYDEDGVEWKKRSSGGRASFDFLTSIRPITPEIKNAVTRRRALRHLQQIKWDELSNEKLLAVLKVLEV